MNLEGLLEFINQGQNAPWDYKMAQSPVPSMPAPSQQFNAPFPGLNPALMGMMGAASQAPQAFGMQAEDDLEGLGRMEDEYMRMASEPMPERKMARRDPNLAGVGLSLLGEFLARSMDRDAYQPGQVLGGYQQGLRTREQRDQEGLDEEYKAEVARRNQMLQGQQIKMRGAERQATRSEKFAQEFRNRQAQVAAREDQQMFQDEQARIKAKEALLDDLGASTDLGQFEMRLAMVKEAGYAIPPEAEEAARTYLMQKQEMAQADMQRKAAAAWDLQLEREAKLDGMITEAEIPQLLAQRQALAESIGIDPEALRLPKSMETLQRESTTAKIKDMERRFKNLEKAQRDNMAYRMAQLELARKRIANAERMGSARINESARQFDLKMERDMTNALEGGFEKARISLLTKIRKAEATVAAFQKAGIPQRDPRKWDSAVLNRDALKEELRMLDEEKARTIGEGGMMGELNFGNPGNSDVNFSGPATVRIPGLTPGVPWNPNGPRPPMPRPRTTIQ